MQRTAKDFKNFSEYILAIYGNFRGYSETRLENLINSGYGISESGESASEVTWSKISGADIGSFTVISPKSIGEFKIVISNPSKNSPFYCENINVKEFKFYDENGNIEASNLLYYHLGVGPTIIKEFEKFLKTSPDCVIFTSNKYEKTRANMYEKYTAKFANKYGYISFFKTALDTDEDGFALVKESKLSDFKKCFKTSNF